jgi:uncharacterized delta-60 repeat protein
MALFALLLFTSSSVADSMVVQPDGKIVVAGEAPGGFGMLARLNSDGSLDPTFGDGGIAVDREAPADSQLGLQSDDAIVALNISQALRRYDMSGSLDQSFGDGSSVRVGGSPEYPTPLAMLPDGRIAVGGTFHVKQNRSLAQAWVVSVDGRSVDEVGQLPSWSWLSALAVRGDASLIMAGAAGSISDGIPAALARFVPESGTLYDPAFGGGSGVAVVPSEPESRPEFDALALTQGTIFAAGRIHDHILLAGFSADGLIDKSFGSDGFAEAAPSPRPSNAYDVAVDRDGGILSAGEMNFDSGCPAAARGRLCTRPALLRFRADGRQDPGYGQAGIAEVTGPDRQLIEGRGETVVPLADGGALLAGSMTPFRKFVARLHSDGRLDPTFGQGGLAIVEACPGPDAARREAGCLPSAGAHLGIHRTHTGHAALRLTLRPNVEWGRIDGFELVLPRQLRPVRGRARKIRARLDMRPNSPPARTTRVAVRGRRLSAHWTYQPSSVSVRMPASALRILKPRLPGRRLPFRLRVDLGTVYGGGPGNRQRMVLRRALR